jgi:hypothetical protein
MRFSKFLGFVLAPAFLLVAGLLAPASAEPIAAPRLEPDCRATVDNPHKSSGAGGNHFERKDHLQRRYCAYS